MTRTTGQKNKKSILPEITLTNPQRLVFGSFLVILGVLVFISILSYFFTGNSDQSALSGFTNRAIPTNNWLSKIGAWMSHLLVYKGFGIASFLFSHLKSRKDFSLSLLRMDDVSIDEGTGNHVANLLVQHERELTFTNLILCISQNILISE